MKAIALLLAAFTVGWAGCGSSEEPEADRDIQSVATDTTSRGAQAGTERAAAIYAAVIRQLVTKDHTFGNAPSPFKRVYIVDGVVPDADAPRVPAKVTRPFAAGLKSSIVRDLADLPPIEFVTDSALVIVDDKDCPRVKGQGVLLSLGPISRGARRVTVANGLFFACLGGQWLTYALEQVDGHWRVEGTTGPVAIS